VDFPETATHCGKIVTLQNEAATHPNRKVSLMISSPLIYQQGISEPLRQKRRGIYRNILSLPGFEKIRENADIL